MTTGEALLLAWICDALNDHVGEQFWAEIVRDEDQVVREAVVLLRTAVAGTLRVRIEELPPEPPPRAGEEEEP
jgi:hypothetical protein